jgi:hypothetical protein
MNSPKASTPPSDSRSHQDLERRDLYRHHHLSPTPAHSSSALSVAAALLMQARSQAPASGSFTLTPLRTGIDAGADLSPERDGMALNDAIALIDDIANLSGRNRNTEARPGPAISTASHSENHPSKPADQ